MAFCFQANVSQAEYERAHREYLKQVQLSHDGQKLRMRRDLHVFQAAGKITLNSHLKLEIGAAATFAKARLFMRRTYTLVFLRIYMYSTPIILSPFICRVITANITFNKIKCKNIR